MRREEWVDREIRTMVQGVHRVLGVGNSDETPVSPLTISGDPPDEDADDLSSPLATETESEAPAAAAPSPPPAAGAGTRRAARRKHKRDKR
jgi:hypothetical protein